MSSMYFTSLLLRSRTPLRRTGVGQIDSGATRRWGFPYASLPVEVASAGRIRIREFRRSVRDRTQSPARTSEKMQAAGLKVALTSSAGFPQGRSFAVAQSG